MSNQWRCTLCPDWLVYAVLLCNRWRKYELISYSCLTLRLGSADSRVSASSTVSWLKLELRRTSLLWCSFPCNCFVSVQTVLKGVTTNETKREPEATAAAESQATANISLLAHYQKLPTANLIYLSLTFSKTVNNVHSRTSTGWNNFLVIYFFLFEVLYIYLTH